LIADSVKFLVDSFPGTLRVVLCGDGPTLGNLGATYEGCEPLNQFDAVDWLPGEPETLIQHTFLTSPNLAWIFTDEDVGTFVYGWALVDLQNTVMASARFYEPVSLYGGLSLVFRVRLIFGLCG
jgi:hypothetical protein